MAQKPSWECEGVVDEIRELRTKTDDRLFGMAYTILCLGQTFECGTRDLEKFKGIKVGDQVRAVGGFSEYNGRTKFDIVNMSAAGKAAAA